MIRRKLRMGLVGGGGSGFIGKVHATAAQLDQQAVLVSGAFTSDPQKSREAAEAFRVAHERSHGSYQELIDDERRRSPEDRVDLISIATPNHLHFPIAMAALRAGFHVVCEKPMTIDLAHARQLADLVRESGSVFVLLHNYSGYPMVRQARQMVAGGELGEIQAVRVNYIQGGLRGFQPDVKPARGAWKSDPKLSGPAGALADIGSHAFQLARDVTGLRPLDLSCQLATFIPGRKLDDYGQVQIRCGGGALMMITFSQATHGRLNDLSIEIDGSLASLAWRQEDPNQLIVRRFGEPARMFDRHPSAAYMNDAGRAACRLPAGHPEAFYEAFANVFRAGFEHIHERLEGRPIDGENTVYPNVYDGVEGVLFIEQCLASQRDRGIWKTLQT